MRRALLKGSFIAGIGEHMVRGLMKIKIYGYSKSKEESPLELKEVTFCVDSNQALALGLFFSRCAEEMKDRPSWEHEHFSGDANVDVIVYNSALMKQGEVINR